MDEVLSEGYVMKITRSDLSTLRGLEWLNDEVRSLLFCMKCTISVTLF